MGDLIYKIQGMKFSKSKRLIADYIVNYYEKAAFMTASKLGDTVGVSESTVVRFAIDLGYDGYPKMQKAIQNMIRNKLTSVQRIQVSTNRMKDRDIVSTVLAADIEKIKTTMYDLDRHIFSSVVDLILASKKIYILGARSSSALVDFLGFYFNLVFDGVKVVKNSSSSEIFEHIFRIGPGDIMIAISFPRYSKRTVKAVKYARGMGARVVAITDSTRAPISYLADYTLVAKSDMTSFADSLVAPLSVINALITAIGMRKEVEITESFDKFENIWDEDQVYEKTEEN